MMSILNLDIICRINICLQLIVYPAFFVRFHIPVLAIQFGSVEIIRPLQIPALKDLPPSYLTGPEWRNRRTMIHRRFTFVVLPSASVILIVAPDLLLTVTFSFLLCNPCPAPHFDYHYKYFIKEIREAVPVMQAFMNLLLLCFRESQIKKLLGLYLSLHTA